MSEAPRFETVVLEWVTGEIAKLTLNRPDAGNSLNTRLASDLIRAIEVVRYEPKAKVLIVTGSGRFFCAGADLKERERPASWIWDVRRAFDLLEELPVPVIAAVNGACRGGGTELALACDFRFVARSVAVGLPEIQFGALPAAGGPQRLLRLVGPSWAKYLVMLGEPVSADEAVRLGLANEVVADADLDRRVMEVAEQLAQRAGYALRAAKFLVNRGVNVPLSDALSMDYVVMERMASPDERAAEVQKAAARSQTYARIFKEEQPGGPFG